MLVAELLPGGREGRGRGVNAPHSLSILRESKWGKCTGCGNTVGETWGRAPTGCVKTRVNTCVETCVKKRVNQWIISKYDNYVVLETTIKQHIISTEIIH